MRPGDVLCPVCGGGPFSSSLNGWTDHDAGARHRMFLSGVPPDEIEAVIQSVHAAGVGFERAMAAINLSLTLTPEQTREAAERLRRFAARLTTTRRGSQR